jgi:hypothetical protein
MTGVDRGLNNNPELRARVVLGAQTAN